MRRLLKLAVVACSVALGLVVVEYGLLRGALGYHGIVNPPIFEHDDELGWTVTPNVDASLSALEFAMRVRTDAMGLRTSGHSDAWRSVPRRALVAGDSFAFGWGVEGDEMLSARLQDGLVASGVQTAVLTAGVPGYSTDQHYLLWRRLEPQIGPEVVVLLLSDNDPPPDNASSASMDGAIYSKPSFFITTDGLELRGVPVPDKQLLPTTSLESLKARLRPLATYALARQFNAAVRAPQAPERESTLPASADALSVTGAILATFNRELRARGGKLLVVLIPSRRTVRDGVALICAEEGIAFLDLGPTFAGRPDLTFKYDGHWTASGHQAAADVVLPVLMELLKQS